MSLPDICMDGMHTVEFVVPAGGMQNAMQEQMVGMPAEDLQNGRQEMEAGMPADAEAVEAQSTEAEDMQAEMQDGMQILDAGAPAEMQAEATKVMPVDGPTAGPDAPKTQAGSVARFLPPRREKTAMENVTMRLSPAVKQKAKALALERGMSLSEFCAAVIDNIVREAGEEQAA